MGICTRRHFLLSICLLQLISTIEKQVFDFLGYMWILILVNFFEIIFVIFGFFGAFQYRPKYVVSYSVWNFVLLAWNIFLICLYLDIGILRHQESTVLKLDPDSSSWWESNGPGCQAVYNTTASIPKLENVTGCLIDYIHVEVFHASVQCLLALLGAITGLCLSKTFLEEDDSFEFLDGDSKNPQHLALQPMYVSYTNLPLTTSSFPSCRSSLQSNRRSVTSDHKNRNSRTFDNLLNNQPSNYTDVSYADTSIDSRLPLNYFAYSPEMKRASHARYKPKPGIRTDQIRKFTQGTAVQRTLSYDRLVKINNKSKSEIVNSPRPKSLYSNAFIE